MLEFYGYFSHILYRDELTGKTLFVIDTENTFFGEHNVYTGVKCLGHLSKMPRGIPLKICGEKINEGKYIEVKSITPQTNSEAATLSFLNNKSFHGIGPKTAEAIVQKIGYKIFDFCKEDNAVSELETIPGVTKKIATDLVNKVNSYSDQQELVEYLTSYGATYSSSKKIYEKYGEKSIEQIQVNPYIMYFAGVNYENREAIAKKIGIDDLDKRRVGAITHEAMERMENSGNTCTTFKELMERIEVIEKSSNMGYVTSPISVLSYILTHKNNFETHTFNDTTYIYRIKMAKKEKEAAIHTLRLCNSGSFKGIIKPYKLDGVEYDKTQKDAFSLLNQSGIAILTGGPGTGKSTLINGFIKAYKEAFPNEEIALCAPTGTAAKRLKEVTGEKATTIHKLLEIKPFGKDELQYRDEYNQLNQTFIIVDEFSMVDTELYSMLCAAIKSGSLLLLVGDEDQLPSVGSGNVLKELLSNSLIRVKRLTNVHRQGKNSTLLENAIKIRNGETDLKIDKTFKIERVKTDTQMKELALKYMEKALNKKDEFKIKLYSPLKKRDYAISTYNINSELHHISTENDNKKYIYNGITFSVGDTVIMLKNNYKKGYFNGDEGIITNIYENEETINVEIKLLCGNTVVLNEDELADFDLGYCITIHKAQGNESDAGIILVPEKPVNLLDRSLIYVAVTRAKKQNIIISQNNALEKAIEKYSAINRQTNLNNRINEAFCKNVAK